MTTPRIDISIQHNLKSSKLFEQYFELLLIYRKKLNHDKVVIIMQVGEFYEIYGLMYAGSTGGKAGTLDKWGNLFERDYMIGTMWNFSDDMSLAIAKKANTTAYGNKTIDVYMAGVPVFSLDKYINTAVDTFGWSVVLIEQETSLDAISGTKKFTRWESQVVTPGTNIFTLQDSNILVVIYLEKINSVRTTAETPTVLYAGVSWLDSLTGECGTTQFPTSSACSDAIVYDDILNLLTTHNPSEVLVYTNNILSSNGDLVNNLHLHYRNHKIIMNDKEFIKIHETSERQQATFGAVYSIGSGITSIFDKLNLRHMLYARTSFSMLLEYIRLRNPHILDKLAQPNVLLGTTGQLVLANNALEQLNIINTMGRVTKYIPGNHRAVYDILRRTKTTMGTRLFKYRLMTPITDITELNSRYNYTATILKISKKTMAEMTKCMGLIVDFKRIERQLARGIFQLQTLPNFVNSIKHCLQINNLIKSEIADLALNTADSDILENIVAGIESVFILDACVDPIARIETNIFRQGTHPILDELQLKIEGDSGLLTELRTSLGDIVSSCKGSAITKEPSESIISFSQNASYGHYLYTTISRIEIIKTHFANRSGPLVIGNGQYTITLKDFKFESCGKNKVRILLDCIKKSGDNLIENTVRIRTETANKFSEWQSTIFAQHHLLLLKLENFIATLDLYQSAAAIVVEKGLKRPQIDAAAHTSFLDAKGLRHPIIEEIQTDIPYVANDIAMGLEYTGILLFGVNAVGKSSLMKSIGIAVIMAQAGFYVAAESLNFKPYEYLFTRIQNNDNIYAGLSSFAVEMSEFKVIMKYANENSIILGDELCSTTSIVDATALVAAGINRLSARKASFVFTTHLHYLSTSKYILQLQNLRMVHLSVSYDATKRVLVYERKLREGSGPSSYGIEVCKSIGLDSDYMDLAQLIRDELNAGVSSDAGSVYTPLKESVYNKTKILQKCEVCDIADASDTHHIKFQCSADSTGMIEHWHKDSKHNLVGLCKACHQAVHSAPQRLKIEGYQATGAGTSLNFTWLKVSESSETLEHPTKVNDAATKLIVDLNKRGITLTAIQSRLRTLLDVKLSRVEITKIIESS